MRYTKVVDGADGKYVVAVALPQMLLTSTYSDIDKAQHDAERQEREAARLHQAASQHDVSKGDKAQELMSFLWGAAGGKY